jgi:hypothetical protein
MPVDFPSAPRPSLSDETSDDYWQARSDARTLKEAEAIKADSSRSEGARFMLEQEEAERQAALEQLDSES